MLLLFLGTQLCQSQVGYEREYRIRKSQFPTLAVDSTLIGHKINKKRYYKEVDSLGPTYILKFKKGRLHYHISFDDSGNLKNSGFRVNEIDLPDETLQEIKRYLSATFKKYSIKRMYQQYGFQQGESGKSLLKNTFQNLLLPSNVYKLIVTGKRDQKMAEYDFWFNAEGNLVKKRAALPMNHDRILY